MSFALTNAPGLIPSILLKGIKYTVLSLKPIISHSISSELNDSILHKVPIGQFRPLASMVDPTILVMCPILVASGDCIFLIVLLISWLKFIILKIDCKKYLKFV